MLKGCEFMQIDENKILTSINPNIDIDADGVCVIPFGVKDIGLKAFYNMSK
jgi:hypothetical protein